MHEAWWIHLELEPWRAIYRSRPACRPAIDKVIVARRSLPGQPLPGSLDANERRLVEIESRLPALIAALGVIALACADHLLLKPHRKALAAYLDIRSCDQLLAFHSDWNAHAVCLAPNDLARAALSSGARWWRRDAPRSTAATLLSTLLAPDGDPACDPPHPPQRCAIERAIKLSRLLWTP
jgi:hypothetical protein